MYKDSYWCKKVKAHSLGDRTNLSYNCIESLIQHISLHYQQIFSKNLLGTSRERMNNIKNSQSNREEGYGN